MRLTKIFFISLGVSLLFCSKILAQEVAEPYSARAYWLEQKNPTYVDIVSRMSRGDSLSHGQIEWLRDYSLYLEKYYAKLTISEQELYQKFKTQWDAEYDLKTKEKTAEITGTKQDEIKPQKKYNLYNGLYGFGYGLAAVAVIEYENDPSPADFAIPFLTAGVGLLWPLLNKPRYENLTIQTVLLARHGKLVGAIHGGALGLAIFGEDISNPAQILVPMVAGSIGLGELGFQLGKHKNWSEGRIATYRYYGLLGPFIGVTGMIAVGAENARAYGIAVPVSAAIGYIVGDKIYNKFQFSRGDMIAASSFGLLSTAAGFGMVPLEENELDMLVPMGMSVVGTVINHALLKNKQLSVKEAWNINYLSGAGVLLGIGVAVITQSGTHYPYFLLPSGLGLLGWMTAYSSQLKNPNRNSSRFEKTGNTSFSVKLMPENYFYNKHAFASHGVSRYPDMPLFHLSMKF